MKKLCSIALLFLMVACGGPQEVSHPNQEVQPIDEPSPQLYEGSDAIPTGVIAALWTSSLKPLSETLEIDKIRALPGLDGELAKLFKPLWADPTDLELLAELGFDLNGPAGVFVPIADEDIAVAFVSIADRAVMVTAIEDYSSQRGIVMQHEVINGMECFYNFNGDKALFILTEKYAYGVSGYQVQEHYSAITESISRAPRLSLHTNAGFVSGFSELASPQLDLVFFVDFVVITEVLSEDFEESSYIKDLRRQANEAKARGDISQARSLDESIRSELRWQERRKKRVNAQNEFLNKYFRPLQQVVGGLSFEQGLIALSAYSPVAEESGIGKLLRQPQEGESLVQSLEETPAMAFYGLAEPDRLVELFELLLKAEGEDSQEFYQQVAQETGISIPQALFPALSGSGGAALFVDPHLDSGREFYQYLDFACYVGVKDDALFSKSLEAVLAHPTIAVFVRSLDYGWSFSVPFWRNVFMKLTADRFVASSYESTVLLEEKLYQFNRPALEALAQDSELSAFYAIDARFFDFALVAVSSRFNPTKIKDISVEEPRTDGARKKHEEMVRLREQAEQELVNLEEARKKAKEELLDAIGTFALGLKIDNGFSIQGGLYSIEASPSRRAELIYQGLMTVEESNEKIEQSIADSNAKLEELRREYRSLQGD